jgi:hypothetical protein
MEYLVVAGQGILPADSLMGLAFAIIKIMAFGALGVVAVGIVASCLCDLFECRKWRHDRGRTEAWQLMH